jgi:hypothetical protein
MDWEGGGIATGIDTNPNFTVDTIEGSFDADCTTGGDEKCPITGTYSGRSGLNGAGAKTVDAGLGHSRVIHDFEWKWVSHTEGTQDRIFATMTNGYGNWLCGLIFDKEDDTVRAWSGTQGTISNPTDADKTYYIRTRIINNEDSTFNCEVYVDEAANEIGEGLFYNAITVGTYPGGGAEPIETEVYGVAFYGGYDDDLDYIVDDTILCDEGTVGMVPAGEQCVVHFAPTGVLALNPPWMLP